MPVYNCAHTLPAAIRSILNQTFNDWELLIIDDGSTDCTSEVARTFSDRRIRLLDDGSHLGLAERLNQGIALSQGAFLARMDGDDIAYPQRLELQVAFLREHPEVDLLGGAILVFADGHRVLGIRPSGLNHSEICRRPWAGFYLAHPTWMGRIQFFREHRYRNDAIRCEDQDLLLRAHARSSFSALPEIVLGYREQRLSLSKILLGRRSFVKCVFRESIRNGNYGTPFLAAFEQLLKGALDCVAVCTGLEYRLLRHRARPASADVITQWKTVLDSVAWRAGVETLRRSAH